MNGERLFRGITDFRVKDLPLGKALLLVPLMGITGKFTCKLLRYILMRKMPVAEKKKGAVIGTLLGLGLSSLEAWIFKTRPLRSLERLVLRLSLWLLFLEQ